MATKDPETCADWARKLGVNARRLRKDLGLKSARLTVTREDILDAMHYGVLDSVKGESFVRLARVIGERNGPYLELAWMTADTFRGRPSTAPRIFAEPVSYDRSAEREISDLFKLYKRAERMGRLDADRRRAIEATAIALRRMRRVEGYVLAARLDAKRGSENSTWSAINYECDLPGVALTKEIFKVAVCEFMNEYARVLAVLSDDPDYVN